MSSSSDEDGPCLDERLAVRGCSPISSTLPSGATTTTTIGLKQLPELLLVEILCRLPCKYAVQCKCVSKPWFTLISSPYFVGHFLSVQHSHDQPIIFTLLIHSSFLPLCKLTSSLSLRFMHPVLQLNYGFVAAMHNDLVLCGVEPILTRHYYICNPCTKQYVALPPAPQAYHFEGQGFICDPYYTYSSSTNSSSTIHINEDYRWMVVKINLDFDIQIFSSKTGEWRKLVLRLIREDNDNYRFVNLIGTPYKGKLYWLGENKWKKYDDVDIYKVKERRRFPFTLELDPFSVSAYPCGGHIIDKYRIIEGPPTDNREFANLFVSHGCLWACTVINVEVDELAIWELKKDQDEDGEEVVGGQKWWYLMHKLPRYETFLNSKDPLIAKSAGLILRNMRVLGLHPNNEDIMYLAVSGLGIVLCNLGTKELEFVAQLPDEYEMTFRMHATFVLPLWPTPIPKLHLLNSSQSC